jgi:hypothetical protein
MMKLWRIFRRSLGTALARHVFRSQILRKSRRDFVALSLPVYFETEEFQQTIFEALRIIAENDKDAYTDVRRHIRAVVEVSSSPGSERLDNVGITLGVHFGEFVAVDDQEVFTRASACSIVQLAVCCKLVNNVILRCPALYGAGLKRRIKRISIERMRRFTINAGFDSRYTYEIECRLQSGAYEC